MIPVPLSPSPRELDRLARMLAFLWPLSWLQTTRGIRLCILLTGGLLGAVAGTVIVLVIAWLTLR